MAGFFDEIGGIVGTVAPMIATAVGGPLAGTAVRFLADKIGLTNTEGKTENQLAAEVAKGLRGAPPDLLAKIQQADQEFAVKMEELGIDLERINAADRSDARARQIAMKDQMPAVIGVLAIAGFFGLLTAMIFVELPPASEAPLNIMLGVLGTLVTAVANFYFGSSAGSKRKTEAMSARLEG